MATKKKMLQAAAGNAGGGKLDVDEVYSTYLYTGNGSTQTITNGIDLDGEGGLVWTKNRSSAIQHFLFDTTRSSVLATNDSNAAGNGYVPTYFDFNSNGFFMDASGANYNDNNEEYASWSFRKAKKFFDVVTWTGTGSARTISHDLGSAPGMILIKQTNTTRDWVVYHRSLGTDNYIMLNRTNAEGPDNSGEYWGGTTPTATEFSLGDYFAVNQNGGTYVAYLFAHNDGDGDFGPDGDADVIKCGSYTGNDGSQEINVGFEPQWLMVKRANGAGDWNVYDSMRNWQTSKNGSGDSSSIKPNDAGAESAYTRIHPSPNGFGFDSEAGAWVNQSGDTYIYVAIRRGPLAVPEDATEVFDVGLASGDPRYPSGFTTDFVIQKALSSGGGAAYTRLLGNNNLAPDTNAQESASAWDWTPMDGSGGNFSSTNYIGYSWKRAPGYFDAVTYTGNGTAGRTVSHNLGVAPEMMWVKGRDVVDHWHVYHTATTADNYLALNNTSAATDSVTVWNDTDPTSSVFTVGNNSGVNGSNSNYIAYLFASCPGVSKVGSYTGNEPAVQTIDCGFSSGARFVLIKRTVGSKQWFLFDAVRGITSTSNDGVFFLNLANASGPESTEIGGDVIQPDSSGFKVRLSDINSNGAPFIFYAVA